MSQEFVGKYTAQFGEGHITVLPWNYSVITQGTWVWGDSSSQVYDGYYYNSTSAQNDQLDYKIFLDVGTYNFYMLCSTGGTSGIVSILIDAVEQDTIDLYSAATTNNVIETITGISVATAGLKTVSLKVSDKNGSSSDYYLVFNGFALYRQVG